MKKRFILASLLAAICTCAGMAQKVEYRESQARLAEPSMGVYIKPLIADLDIDETVGKIRDKWEFTNKDVDALSNSVANLRARALFRSAEKHDADVIVAASFDIESMEDGKGYYVTVIGYPAKYVKWRTATPEDQEWIRQEKMTSGNTKDKEATQAINK